MEGVDRVNFAFADTHGDLNIRLNDIYKGKFVCGFFSMKRHSGRNCRQLELVYHACSKNE